MEKLKPFTAIEENFSLEGELAWKGDLLSLRFCWKDPGGLLQDGPGEGQWTGSELKRADGLWRTTCFEAFWGKAGQEAYWELNVSGEGEWNLYRFESYREPQPPSPSADFSVRSLTTSLGELECLLAPNVPITPWEASLCAVVRLPSGVSYFSTLHAGPKPDFHLRTGFGLAVKRF
jgi:hypothetical protein